MNKNKNKLLKILANEETDECEVLTTAFKCVVEKYGELKKHEDQDASTPSTLQFFLKLSA